MNERPVDEKWVEQADLLAEESARALNSFVVLIAVQDMGKLGISIGGADLPGEEIAAVREMAKTMPMFLMHLARMAYENDKAAAAAAAKKKRVVIEPGAFDDFEGTPEELADLVATIHSKFEDSDFPQQARLLTPEEEDEVAARMAAAAKRRERPQ